MADSLRKKPHPQNVGSANGFRAASLGGSVTFSWTPPPATSRPGPGGGPPATHGSPGDSANDPAGLPGTSPTAATATCYETCSVETELADAMVNVTAVDQRTAGSFGAASTSGKDRAVLFAQRNGGGTKPDCPGYRTTFSDWVQFGFQDPARGATYRKTATFTGRHPTARAAASAASGRMQICFEAPYAFQNRAGYRVDQHGVLFTGVLPECTALGAQQFAAGAQTPCVKDRQIVRSGNGWVVRIVFSVPASRQDPKALG